MLHVSTVAFHRTSRRDAPVPFSGDKYLSPVISAIEVTEVAGPDGALVRRSAVRSVLRRVMLPARQGKDEACWMNSMHCQILYTLYTALLRWSASKCALPYWPLIRPFTVSLKARGSLKPRAVSQRGSWQEMARLGRTAICKARLRSSPVRFSS